jgi:hypothetical protein
MVAIGNKPLSYPHVHDEADHAADDVNADDHEEEEPQIRFVGNQIKSSKYTIITFIPR